MVKSRSGQLLRVWGRFPLLPPPGPYSNTGLNACKLPEITMIHNSWPTEEFFPFVFLFRKPYHVLQFLYGANQQTSCSAVLAQLSNMYTHTNPVKILLASRTCHHSVLRTLKVVSTYSSIRNLNHLFKISTGNNVCQEIWLLGWYEICFKVEWKWYEHISTLKTNISRCCMFGFKSTYHLF